MGPLAGMRVLELGGIGPGPFGGMVLSDLGADAVRLDRPAEAGPSARAHPLDRGRRSVTIDLKHPLARDAVLSLVTAADAVIEGFRPGVTERLGLGPDDCLAANPRIVYGRITGWGQDGPLASTPGHDINYLARAGVLAHLGRPGAPPVAPINLLADFGGGGMLLAAGILAAWVERGRSGKGQVVDAAMVDGAALLMTMTYGFFANGSWSLERGTNLLDGGAPFYDVYETADGKYVAVGANEAKFYARLVSLLGLDDELPLEGQYDKSDWPRAKALIAAAFRTRTRDAWEQVFAGEETCFAPVLDLVEATTDEHNVSRGTFVTVDGVIQPGPAPRFDRTPAPRTRRPPDPGAHTTEVLLEWGAAPDEVRRWTDAGAVLDSPTQARPVS